MRARFASRVAVLAFVALLVDQDPAWSDEAPSPLGEGPLRVAVDPDYPPFEYRRPDGRVEGFNLDLFAAVASVAGLEYAVEVMPWPEIRSRLESGTVDLSLGVFRTPARTEKLDFSVPTAWVHHVVFVREDSGIRDASELAGKQILMTRLGIHHDYVRENDLPVTPITTDDTESALRRLAAGEADAAVSLDVLGLYLVRDARLPLRSLGQPIDVRKLRFAVGRGRSELLARLNDGLEEVRYSGEYDAIYDRWFGVLTPAGVEPVRVALLLALALGLGGAVAGVAWFGARVLQREVERRTHDLIETDAVLRATLLAAPELALFEAEAPGDSARIVEWSAGAARTFGQSRREALALRVSDLRSEAGPEGGAVLHAPAPGQTFEMRRSTGEPFPAHVIAQTLEPGPEGLARLLYVVVDLSERESLVREKRELEANVHDSLRMKALGELAGGVARDFRNLLTVIDGNVELMASQVDSQGQDRLGEIRGASATARGIVDRLLAFGEGQQAPTESTHWNRVVEAAEPILRRSLPEGVTLDLRTVQNPAPIRIDLGAATQVLVNLVLNARDALRGRGHIVVETANLEGEGPRMGVLRVTDDGPGIDPEIRDRIFEAFSSTKEPGQGTGLGLFSVQRIVEQAQGRVAVETGEGRGSSFEIALPGAAG